jgi:leucine dehydrogenase
VKYAPESFAEFDNHETVSPFKLQNKAIIGFAAIHSTKLGPALGGTRILHYKSNKEALSDALRLSRAMTYKCAIAGLPFGGGKGVIIIPQNSSITQQTLRQYAQFVNTFQGNFHTGEDVGLTEKQVHYMLKFSPYFIGKPNQAGDPSPFAGESAFISGKVALKHLYGTDLVLDKKVLIKGIGKTGSTLAKYYIKHGAEVYVTDIDAKKIKSFTKDFPEAKGVTISDMYATEWDIFAPCALGNELNSKSINKLKAKIVAGTANNQLESQEIAEKAFKYGMLHIPDYISNAGGLINVADELLPGGYNRRRVHENIQKLKKTLEDILSVSKRTKRDPDYLANKKVEEILAKKRVKSTMVTA